VFQILQLLKEIKKMDIQDILIYESGDGGEMKLKNDDLETVSSITNSFYLALFSSKTSDWWGNSELLKENPFASTFEKTLDSVSLNSSGLKQLEQAALEDLNFIKQYGEITVYGSILDLNKISLKINFLEPSGSEKIIKFVFDKLRNEIIEEVTI
jgi:phage gp46-like protein